MQLFIVRPDGEVHGIPSDQPIKTLLESNQCYILNDDDRRVVYLWKGAEASVRLKFIGANTSQTIRGQVGIAYDLKTIDEGDEPPEFLDAAELAPGTGFALEIRESMDQQVDYSQSDSARSAKTYRQIMEESQQEGPFYTGDGETTWTGGVADAGPSMTIEEALEQFDKEALPEGYTREMVVVGKRAYSIVEKVSNFLGQKKVEQVFDEITQLPEGIMFADDYVPRVLCMNQAVVAVEFLKRK
jgi:hypothetical protein